MSSLDAYWVGLGAIEPGELTEARIEAHCATQLVAAAADAFLENQEGGSHRVLTYFAESGTIATERVEGTTPMRFGLSIHLLELLLLDPDGAIIDALPLVGQTLGTALDWIRGRAEAAGNASAEVTLPTELKLPLHPLLGGAAFSGDLEEASREIGRYFANSELLLKAVGRENKGASRVEVRPEGFEMRVRIPRKKSPDNKRVAVGFSPGNRYIQQPFWYVLPRPAPAADQLVVIAEPGEWIADNLKGAALKASDLLGHGGEQSELVAGFYRRASTLCRGLIA